MVDCSFLGATGCEEASGLHTKFRYHTCFFIPCGRDLRPQAKAHVNVAYWGGLVPANADRHDVLRKLLDHGALGFKSFMCHSGINDFPDVQVLLDKMGEKGRAPALSLSCPARTATLRDMCLFLRMCRLRTLLQHCRCSSPQAPPSLCTPRWSAQWRAWRQVDHRACLHRLVAQCSHVPDLSTPFLSYFLLHSSDCGLTDGTCLQGSDPTKYSTWLRSRPPKFEQDAIKLLIDLLDKDTTPAAPGFKVHIAHLADASAIPMIQVRGALECSGCVEPMRTLAMCLGNLPCLVSRHFDKRRRPRRGILLLRRPAPTT